ncbi:hypothetical protein, partial [Actinophytocola sediminis]
GRRTFFGMTDTTPPATPAPTTPAAPAPTAPAAVTPPATPAAPATGQPAADAPKPTDPGDQKFTQADLDRILTDRLSRQEKTLGEKFAKLFGGEPEGDGKQKPEDVLAKATAMVEQAQARANAASARSYAQDAGIKKDRVGTLVGMVDMTTALSGVDTNDAAAVEAAIRKAVDAKVEEFPEWKASTVPGASTANPNGAPNQPDIDAKIAAATKAGNHREAIALKRQKMRQQQTG